MDKALTPVEATPAPLGEWLLRALITSAKAELEKANAACGDDWPAGQRWHELSGTSQSTFMIRARRAAGIPDDAYLAWIRSQTEFDAEDIYSQLDREKP